MTGNVEMKIRILHEPSTSEPFVILEKPSGLPSAPLSENDDCALFQAMKLFPQIDGVSGRKPIERGLVHRIDTDTRGLVLVAASQDFYELMIEEQACDRFVKHYSATCRLDSSLLTNDSYPPHCDDVRKFFKCLENSTANECSSVSVSSRFRFFGLSGREVRPVTELSGMAAQKKAGNKIYTTEIIARNMDGGLYSASCRITRGFKHQVRCHLSWVSLPVLNDALYDPAFDGKSTFDFTACTLEFLGYRFSL